jgi:hypothetical protein
MTAFVDKGRLRREEESYRENPNDLGVDRRVADLDAHGILQTILSSGVFGVEFAKITVMSKTSDGDPAVIELRNDLDVLVRTLTITYDSDGDFQELVKS